MYFVSIVVALAFDLQQQKNSTLNRAPYIYREINCVGIAPQRIQWKLLNNSYQSCNKFSVLIEERQ